MIKTVGEEIITVEIEAELDTLAQLEEIFGRVDSDSAVQLCDDKVELQLITAGNSISFDGEVTATLLMSFYVSVASSVLGNIIYALICRGAKKLVLNGRRTRVTEKSITQAIETIKTMKVPAPNKEVSSEDSDEAK